MSTLAATQRNDATRPEGTPTLCRGREVIFPQFGTEKYLAARISDLKSIWVGDRSIAGQQIFLFDGLRAKIRLGCDSVPADGSRN
jgi:hypothetical protein